MQYNMTAPCDECPFLKGSGFEWERLHEFTIGEFPCHKACKLDDETETKYVARSDKTPHCAGALIFMEKVGRPHQMMRICERIGHYDRTRLDMSSEVVEDPSDCERPRARRG